MKKAANIKTGLFAFIFMMLLLPALQKTISIFPVKPLEGSFDLAEKPQFSWKAWISGSYQEQYTRYLEDHIGFRNLLVRIRNQISFSLYNKTLAQNVAIGKEGVLYQDFVIEAMLGQDFIGETALRTNAEKLKFIQDTLHKKNIELVFVIAPGKSSVLPEYIPESYDLTTNRPSNYDVWTKFLNQLDVRFLDLKSYFLAIKDTCRYPLFPRCGTHWSGYGVTLAADTMFRYLESRLGYDIPGFISDQGILTSTDLRFTDDDISKGMNLLWSPANWPVYYPEIKFQTGANLKKPNVLSIGDSFNQSFWGFYPFFGELTGPKSVFWYYDRTVAWPEEAANSSAPIASLNLQEEIESRDIILIITTEQNLSDPGFGFIARAYQLYDPAAPGFLDMEIAFEDQIWNDSTLYYRSLERSLREGMSIDEAIKIDARMLAGEKMAKRIRRTAEYEATIRSDKNWLIEVSKKAKENGVTLDEMIRLDAEWMAKQDEHEK